MITKYFVVTKMFVPLLHTNQIRIDMTIEQLATELNGKLWIKGDMKRIYLDCGHNTKKMSTKVYVYQTPTGKFDVSCYIDCPSQSWNWIKAENERISDYVLEKIDRILNPEKYANED